MGCGRTMVRSCRGPISHPTGQPSRSWKYVETGTSLYVQPRRLTKLVTSGQTGTSKKSSKKSKETTVEGSAEGSTTLRADIKALKQAMEATEEATAKCYKAAEDMFQLYANLLSVDARYL
jgi:hypothetical protein